MSASTPDRSGMDAGPAEMVLGIDVGSTTVKLVAVDPASRAIVWSDYRRHEARQAETLSGQLAAVERRFGERSSSNTRAFITGSGATPLVAVLGAKFVQEVNAVTVAVDALHPDVGSVVELGGQDAKVIIYKEAATPGARRVIASMNDKCASGTGATIDKCVTKVGLSAESLGTLEWNPQKLHPVAAKCGVFAETDIVNLVKSGIPAPEVMCSLADAIVMQNLSVLTRGNTLRHRVLLLGGPNTYLPFLQGCWRQRIQEMWQARSYQYPSERPIEELAFVPARAELYAAYGAAVYGLEEPATVGRWRGVQALQEWLDAGGNRRRSASHGPPLVASEEERAGFVARYRVPRFDARTFGAGERVRGYLGIDGGSTSSKAVLIDATGAVLCKEYQISRGNPLADAREILHRIRSRLGGAVLEVQGVGATGYAADILEQTMGADANIVETVAHAMAATSTFPDVDVVCDIGGQDIKVLFIGDGRIKNFRLSNQCSAGNGMLLQAMAAQFGVPMHDYADVAFSARATPMFNYGCAVFLDTDRVTFQREGYGKPELMAGLALVLPKNIWQYVVQLPRLASLGRVFVLQGGTQYNLAAVKAQHDYIAKRVPGAVVHVHPHCGEAGAIGAALEAKRVVERRGFSTFVGLDAAIGLEYATRNDESTVCRFCPNACKRTFIDAVTPSGARSRYIAGFSCENGTVESKEALKALAAQRKSLKAAFPNLVDYEARLAFKHFYAPARLPEAGSPVRRAATSGWWQRRATGTGAFARSSPESAAFRAGVVIGMPRVLNMYSTGPFWRTYFETLGVASHHVVFSEHTDDEMWQAGARYASIDPCFPAKVALGHVQQLLAKRDGPALRYLFFPCLTHVPSFVQGMPDSTACPVVAGTPKVVRAAFTKETDHFAQAGVEFVDPAITLTEPFYLKEQLFGAWGTRLGVTRDESDFAVDEAFIALRRFDAEVQHRGMAVLEALERDNKVGILVLARPYHNDPGLNHDVLDEFQALGYPILSIRSIPKDPAWLQRFFAPGPAQVTPLSVSDVWPEAYSTNSAEKVWAAKFAARHPNLVVLDFSSFKCGHDAPTYGMIDSIVGASRTPYAALHDLDSNKPAGSINIRVRTYAYALQRHSERLQELRAQRTELERLVDAKRQELYARRTAALAADTARHERAQRERAVLDAIYAECPAPETSIGRAHCEHPAKPRGVAAEPQPVVIHWPARSSKQALRDARKRA